MPDKPVVVRIAPSPTGRVHLATGRTALYNYLFARQMGGKFILRIEDTDRKRYVPGAEQELMNGLRWLGLEWDEGPDVGGPNGPYYQTQRRDIYQQYVQQLIAQGDAYPCFCTPERLEQVRQEQLKRKHNPRYDGACRELDPDEAARRVAAGEKHVIRLKMPHSGSITVNDLLRGPITVDNSSLDDSILVKSDGLAVYHLAAMVDDHLMGISHVIRGAEWLPSLPLHGHIYRVFGWEMPVFVHLSLFLKPNGKGKMSKRDAAEAIKDGHSIFLEDLHQLGYLPEGVLNWIALIGWSYDDRTEFFTLPDLLEKFSLDKLNPAPAAINFTKLDYFDGLHMRALEAGDLAQRIRPFMQQAGYQADLPTLRQIAPLIRERLVTLEDAPEWIGFFFRDEVRPSAADLLGAKMTAAETAQALRRALAIMEQLTQIDHTTAEPPLRLLAEELGLQVGQLFGILRVAVTGQKVSPPLFESMAIIGREKVLERIRRAIQNLEA